MNVNITGRHMEMTDALKSYIEGGLGKVRSHFDQVIDVDVVLTVEKHRHIAEVNLHANGIRIHGRETSSDMYASVDAVLAKLDRQVRRHKEKINRHQPRKVIEGQDYHHNVIEVDHNVEVQEGAEEMVRHHVVLREKLPMRPMSVDESAMQLDLSPKFSRPG